MIYFYQEHELKATRYLHTVEIKLIYSFGQPYKTDKTIVGLEPSYRYVSRMNGHKMCLP